MQTRYNFKEIAPINELMAIITSNKDYLSKAINVVIKELEENDLNILNKWKKSNRTDFSIYQDTSYQLAGLYCYHAMTKRSMYETMKYIYNNFSNPEKLKIFDDYNGVGISTVYFMKQGLNVSFMNDNKVQIDSFTKLCNYHNLEVPFNDQKRENRYDIVLSYEIAEHYQKPEEYLDVILSMIKPGGLLIISHSFNYPEAPGHFISYEIGGVNYDNKTASRVFNKKIKEYCIQVHRGWNGTPLIFKRDLNEKNSQYFTY